jgi:hypothetical protein
MAASAPLRSVIREFTTAILNPYDLSASCTA